MCSALFAGTVVRLAIRARIAAIVGSDWHAPGLHHAVDDVRTACTPSPATERAKWRPAISMTRSHSASLRKLSKATTHGLRLSTRGAKRPCTPASAARANMLSTEPAHAAGCWSWARRQVLLVVIAHHEHAQRHSRYMRSGSLRHSPSAASALQRVTLTSWQPSDWHSPHVTRHCVLM